MAREIEVYEPSGPERKIKIIAASPSRSGTISFLYAMEKLGYTPYHMLTAVTTPDGKDLRVLREALLAQRPHTDMAPYSRADYDKWFKSYDCLVEIPYLLDTGIINAYRNDPDIKFVLVERDASSWADSCHATAGWLVNRLNGWEIQACKHVSRFLTNFTRAVPLVYARQAAFTKPDEPGSKQAMAYSYNEYIKMVKTAIPPERLLVTKVEDGFDWQTICDFLGKDVPDEPYPRGNSIAEFRDMIKVDVLEPNLAPARARLVGLLAAVPVVLLVGARWWRSTS